MIRFLTTIVLAAAVLAGVWYLPLFPFQILILCAIGAGLWEYTKLLFADNRTRFFTVLLGLAMASLMTWYPDSQTILLGLTASIFFSFLWMMAHKEPLSEAIHRVGLIALAICYLSLTLPAWSWIKTVGREWVMLLLFPACLTDTFGFLVGKSIGRKKLAPIVSPNKTWEGFFGSLVGGIFGLWLASWLFSVELHISPLAFVSIGVSISLVAIFGDLIESLIKRSVGVKDSSHLIPGHGGALDRLDALIFVAPFFYFVLRFL